MKHVMRQCGALRAVGAASRAGIHHSNASAARYCGVRAPQPGVHVDGTDRQVSMLIARLRLLAHSPERVLPRPWRPPTDSPPYKRVLVPGLNPAPIRKIISILGRHPQISTKKGP